MKLLNRIWDSTMKPNLAIILSFVFGFQFIRLLLLSFVGYLRDSRDIAALDLAPYALGVFALSFLAVLINRLFTTSRSVQYLAIGLGLIRLTEQIVHRPDIDLILAGLGTTFFLILLALLVGQVIQTQKGHNFFVAFVLGLSLDSALLIAFDTLDLSWQPGWLATVLVFLLVGIQVQSSKKLAKSIVKAQDLTWKSASLLVIVGALLALQLLVFQNIGAIGSLVGLEAYSAGFLLLLGNALGIFLVPMAAGFISGRVFSVISFLLLGLLLYALPSSTGLVAAVLLLGGQAISMLAFFKVFTLPANPKAKEGLGAISTMMGFGMVIFVLANFIYYATYDINFGFRANIIPPALAILALVFGLLANAWKGEKLDRASLQNSLVVVALLTLIPIIKWVSAPSPTEIAAPAGGVHVMDYNLHNAVNTSGQLDPEAIAQVIENSGAEIVAMQEVSRGWLTWGGMDMLSWLANRLNMYYVWGPTADPQWGNAVFSKYPIESYELGDLPPEDVLLLRGYISAEIDLGADSLQVIATHFVHREEQGPERLQQSSAILSAWNQEERTIFMGDLNALPDAEEVALLIENGLIDISREIGEQPVYTYYADHPDHQIDYIFVSPDLGYSDFEVLQSSASDHLPLVATIYLNP